MKKILFLAFAAILAMGCEGPRGPEGPAGPPGEQGEGMNWDILDFTVESNQWHLSQNSNINDLGSYYFYEIKDPKLTQFIVENGLVNVYLYQTGGVQAPLPLTRYKGEGETLWSETFDFDFATGSVFVYVTYSDFMTQTLPETLSFRIVKNW